MSRADRQERKAVKQELAAAAAELDAAPTVAAKQQVLHAAGIDDVPDSKVAAFADHLRQQAKKG